MKKIEMSNDEHRAWVRRREFLKLGGAGILGVMVAAATTSGVYAQDKMPDMKNIKSNLKKLRWSTYNQNYIPAWPLAIARAKGYFEEVGFDEIEYILAQENIAGMIGGSIDIAHHDTDQFMGASAASGTPMKIISIFRQKEFWIMGVRKGIDGPEDLKGAKISGGSVESRNTWIQKQILKKLGVAESDVEFVPVRGASDGRLQAVMGGQIDAASVFPRHEAGLKEVGGKFLYNELVDAPQESYASLQSFIDANEDAVYAYMLADIKARQWLFDPANKDEAFKIARDFGFDIPPEFEAQYDVELEQISPDGGFVSPENMDEFVEVQKMTGEIPKDLNWRDYVDMRFVWAAQDALGLPRRPASI
jgi:ABC-type nitrate/sulfonate/bicarbonate transport system substrate-binding protein